MHLSAAGEIGGEERCSCTAAEVAGEVGERGDLVYLVGWHAYIVERADGDKDEGQANDLEHAPEGDGSEGGVEVEPGEVVDAGSGGEVAETDHDARVEFAERTSGHGHHDHHDEACWR